MKIEANPVSDAIVIEADWGLNGIRRGASAIDWA